MIIYAGEMLDGRMLQPWIARHGTATGHINMFGPTETTVVVMYAPLAGADLVEPGSIIGIPVPDSQAYILDSQMEPVPTGIGGEIYIGGPGLCRGYLARPELTAERFVPNPFSSQPGARLYRTGDLGRYRSDGRIEYLGRADRQVKVRGFRIELTEIEVVLRRHPAVLDTVVEVVEVAGDRRLVCYLTFQPGATVTAGELRRFARESMPDYMVPASFVLVPDFPRSTTGKLDRSALIDLPGAEPLREGRGTPPATASEELIATMWAELIGTQQVDRDDSFFDIGGHSLAATRLAGRLHEAFGVEIPLRTIFEEPTLRGLGERVEALRSSFRAELPPIRRRGGHRRALSFAQQRLWFLEQLEPGAAYNVPVALRLRGSLDVAAVHAGLNQVIARHEVLRTRFVSDDGDARQEILDERAIDLRNVDLTGESTTGQLASVRRLAADQARDGFDLAAEPLMRATLARLSANDHVLILTIHHIVIDGWSIAVLLREMAAAYRALTSAEGETEPLPPLAVQYADYGDWQREWLKGQALEQQVGFWSARLAGLPPLLALPTDRPRSADRARRAEVEQVEIDRALTGDLLRLGRALNATPFMTLLAGLKVVLARHSGQDDIAIGTPVANRMRPELEPLIGFFANTVVIRTVLEDDPSFADLVGRVRSASLDAFAHQDVPFEQVVDAVQPERSLSHTPLFQVLFVLQNAPLNALDVPGLTVEPLAQPATTAKFDLTISVEERAGAFAVAVEYDADLFDRDTVRRMLRQFVQLLSAAVVEPASPVSRLPLLSRRERDELLAAAASGAARRASAVTALLDTQFASSRPAIAVDDGQRRLTYETLDREANQLARFLREGGASRERPVALCLDRSIEFIVSLLGIVKSGAGCVPLDYSYPADRLNLMLADANASLLVTRSGLVRGLATGDTRVVLIDEMRSEIASQPANPFDAGTVGDDLLYQLYTSGSTGQPKGVRVPHRVLSNLVQWSLEHGFDAPLRTLQFTPITFDVSFQEILSCWSSGGTLVLVNDEIRRDPDALLDFLRAHAIERLFLPFVALQGLADAASGRPDDELPRSLRQVITAGEQLRTTPALVQFFTRLDGCQLHNHYGPTETHVITAHHLAGPPSEWPALPPIGAAIDGAALHVLDQHLEPVPPGVPGELYAGGVVVADGYARRPELTAERFIADPFASGGRLYRTGDYVRRRADGVFEFLGRRDAQVKVRGFRVELGEIETVLTSHPAVAQAAVIADARQRLLAFVVPTAGAPVDASALRMHAKKTLPEYMVPAGFIALDALPTTSSGKVNRKALPIPDRLDAGIADDRMATIDRPRTPTEDRLHAIWQDVLGVSGVDVHESFFDVGGHSLLAARLASRIRREFGVGLPLKRLFESPTIAELAIALDASDDTVMETSVIPRAERRDEMPCSFAQERMWFLSRLEGSSGAFNMPAALRLKGALNIPALDATLSQILQRHEVLRTRFTERNGRVLQVISPEGKLSLPVIDLQDGDRTSDKESRQVIDEFVQRPFDLEHGFPIRFALVRHGAADHVLLVALHHIAADGWSLGVLAREVTTLYAANARGEASPLPALAIQYADFAAWQRERLTDAALAPHRDYWRRQLDGVPPQLTIAGMRPRPASPTFSGATVPLNVDPVRAQQLRSYAQHAGVTLSTALMTAYAATLYRLSGQDDFVIAAPIANRTRPELEPLIGFFVNQLPVRVRAAGHMGFAELSRQIQGTLLDGLAHEDLPFEKIVEDLPKKMRAEHPAPISGFVFVLQNWPRVPLDLAGVEITPEPAESRVAKFDMTMSFDDTADGLSGSLEYATDLFESATIAHLVTVFARVVDLMIETPDGKLLDARPQPTPGAGDEAEFAFDESQP
jgi:amino acid adenylation domain-containing protein